MSGIFLSYRRTDVPDAVGRVYDNLRTTFRRHEVFKDVDSVPVASDFRIVINRALKDCRIVLVAIGPNWLDAKDKNGNRRLDDPNDYVRMELESALERRVPMIPILLSGATVPPAEALPETLRPLAFLQALPVRGDPDFATDISRLKRDIKRLLSGPWRRLLPWAGLLAGVTGSALVAAWALGYMQPKPKPKDPSCVEIPFIDNSKMPPVITTETRCN